MPDRRADTEVYYLFSNLLGNFVFDSSLRLVEEGDEKLLRKKYDAQVVDARANLQILRNVLAEFKQQRFFSQFHEKNLDLTKKTLKESVGKDSLIIQTINSINELDKVTNTLVKRLREWYELYNPELSVETTENARFVDALASGKNMPGPASAGAELTKEDVDPIMQLALSAKRLFELRHGYEGYLDSLMQSLCPNVKAVAGSLIGAKLISYAGSLKRLSELPSSTVQILGAEKALFRHMKTGAKPPKFGILYQHQLIQRARRPEQGKAARLLADKIAIAAKVDYFKGKFMGDELLKDIERRLRL
jgi:nucleolar protein 56